MLICPPTHNLKVAGNHFRVRPNYKIEKDKKKVNEIIKDFIIEKQKMSSFIDFNVSTS